MSIKCFDERKCDVKCTGCVHRISGTNKYSLVMLQVGCMRASRESNVKQNAISSSRRRRHVTFDRQTLSRGAELLYTR